MRRLLFLIVLMVVILPDTQGQSIYSLQQNTSWQFRYSTSRKASQYTNKVLKQLALAYLKQPENASFTFFYNYGVSVGFQQGNLLDVTFALTPSICTGDVLVHEFDLQKLLVPAYCSLRLSVVNPYNVEVFSYIHENLQLSDLMAGYTLASFPDSLWTRGCKVEVQFRGFRFDEQSFLRIEKELFAIRDYDAAATLADTLEKRIRQSRVGSHTPSEAFRTYVFCSKGIFLLNEAVKTKTEIVPGNDPRKLLAKAPVVVYQFKDLTNFLTGRGITGSLTGNAYLYQALAFGSALSDALTLSQKVDYYSSPFYYRLYSNSTSTGQLLDAANTIKLFAEIRGLATINLSLLSRKIVNEYLRLGDRLMAEGRYAEAADMLTSATRFCSVNPMVSIPERLTSALARARTGLTASYIRIVQKALDNNLPTLADKYLEEAVQYSARYNNMNAADSAGFAGLYGVLTGKNIQAGNGFLARKNYQAALTEFDKAAVIATQFKLKQVLNQAEEGQIRAVNGIFRGMVKNTGQSLSGGNPDIAAAMLKEALGFADGYPAYRPDPVSIDSLNQRIAIVSYNLHVQNAAESARILNHEKAVLLLVQASGLSRDHHIVQTALYDSIVAKSGISRINELLSEGRLKLWAGEPEIALTLAGEAMQLVAAFDLTGRVEIKQQYALLMDMADESLCARVNGELNSIIIRAGENFRQNKFDEAAVLVMQARELIYSRAMCGLNTVELNKLTSEYQYPVRWNEMMKSATALIAAGDYLKGVEIIQQAGAVFDYYRLDTLGLLNSGLFGLAMSTEHIPLLKYAIGHYIARGGYDEALQLLGRLFEAGVSASETAEFQESLARGLAKRDLAETDVLNLKTMLKVYTNGDKWYRRFADVYKFHVENR